TARCDGVRHYRHVGLEALHLGWVDIDPNDLRSARGFALVAHYIAPANVRHLEAAPDSKEDVDVVPQLACCDARNAGGMILGHDAAAAAERRHGRLQDVRELADFACGVLCAGAAHDQRLLSGREQLYRGLDRVEVDGWLLERWVGGSDCGRRGGGH